jgi:hypothetical protein
VKRENRGIRWGFFSLWLSAALACTACVKVHVTDMQFVALEPASPEEARVVGFASGYHDDVLRIRFRTSENLSDVYRRSEAGGAYVRITLCPFDEDHSVGFSTTYFRGDRVRVDPDTTYGPPPYEYEGFFRYVSQYRFEAAQHGMVYSPLPPSPQDLCFRLLGPGWVGFDSNTGIIPKEVLIRALASLRK